MFDDLAAVKLPKWREVEHFVKNPELLTWELLFLVLTLSNVFVLYSVLQEVCRYPVFLTWFQLAQGLLMAYILGENGKEFSKLQYFPAVRFDVKLMKELLLPSICYSLMLALGNMLLYNMKCISVYPVMVGLSVIFHHILRHVGCDEQYKMMRKQSIGLMLVAYLITMLDLYSVSVKTMILSVLFATVSAVYRGGYLPKILHVVEGNGNLLQNNQAAVSLMVLPIFAILCGEWRILLDMPLNPMSQRTWQVWGCIVTAGFVPFVKNIVSNRLIKRTGQAPWRVLEILSMALVFLIGLQWTTPGFFSFCAILVLLAARSLGACDAIISATTDDYSAAYFATAKQAPSETDSDEENVDDEEEEEEEDDDDDEDERSYQAAGNQSLESVKSNKDQTAKPDQDEEEDEEEEEEEDDDDDDDEEESESESESEDSDKD